MRRLKRPKRDVRVSLFPFLAVLLCTMGALIVLLVLITGLTRLHTATAEDSQPKVEPPPAARPEPDLTEQKLAERKAQRAQLEARIQLLRSARAELLAAVDRRRSSLAAAEMELARRQARRDELNRLAAQLDRGPNASADLAALEQQLKELDQLLQAKQDELQKKQREKADRKPSFAIIPYLGPYQTKRRPIYIECRANSIVMQPEGIVFTEQDFLGPSGPGNPLARAIRAAAEQILLEQNAAGEERTPYPLLLVRPDGIGAYYAARAAIKTWGSEFGYELVEADWDLDFPPLDKSIQLAARRAADDARQRLRELAVAAPGLFSHGNAQSFRVSRNGLVPEGGPPTPSRGQSPFRPFAGMDSGSRPGYGGPGGGQGEYGEGGTGEGSGGTSAYDSLAQKLSGSGGQQSGSGGQSGSDLPPGSGGSGRYGQGQEGNRNGSSQGGSANGSSQQANATGAGNPGGAGSPGGDRSQQAAGGQIGSPGGSAGSAGSGAMGGGGSGSGSGQPGGQLSASFGGGGRGSMQSLAGVRGANWALPNVATGSIGVQREVRIDCYDDRLILMPEQRVIPLDRHTADIVDELVTILWEKVNKWGVAGDGMHWKPLLNFHVAPSGTRRYQELAELLRGSGMDVRGVRKQER